MAMMWEEIREDFPGLEGKVYLNAAATSLIAIWAVWSYPLTEERAHEIRTELERRRGAAPGAAEA